MHFLIQWWTAISLIGVTQSARFLSNRPVILCNQICLITIIDTLLYEAFFISFGIRSLIVFHAICIALYCCVLLLNRKGHYQRASVLLAVVTARTTFFFSR